MQTTHASLSPSDRPAVVSTLAAVGFLALVGFGMWLAVYSARFVPSTVSSLSSAAVALSSVFKYSPSGIATTSTPTTIPFGEATSTAATSTASGSGYYGVPTAGQQTSTTEQIGGSGSVTAPYGLPDLAASITAVGYLTSNTTDSFVASSSVPSGMRPAVKFTIKNVGTNVAGAWAFSASIPTQNAFIYQSQPQQALNPGDSIDYTLGFDSPLIGTNEKIVVNANYNNAIAESATNNNIATAFLNVQ